MERDTLHLVYLVEGKDILLLRAKEIERIGGSKIRLREGYRMSAWMCVRTYES